MIDYVIAVFLLWLLLSLLLLPKSCELYDTESGIKLCTDYGSSFFTKIDEV